MLELVQLPADKKVSIYVDRAIAAQWFYEAILKHPQLEIITWEKGFKASAQPLERIDGQFASAARAQLRRRSPRVSSSLSTGPLEEKSSTDPVGGRKRPIRKIKPLL